MQLLRLDRHRPPGPPLSLRRALAGRVVGRRMPGPLALLLDARRYGAVTWWRTGLRETWLVTQPGLAHEGLVDRADELVRSPRFQEALRPFFGEGLLVSDGRHHRRRRRVLMPAFQTRNL